MGIIIRISEKGRGLKKGVIREGEGIKDLVIITRVREKGSLKVKSNFSRNIKAWKILHVKSSIWF